MKKYILALCIVLSFAVSAPAFAMTQQEIQSQIQVLMQKVQALQAQLGASGGISIGAASLSAPEKIFCFNFNKNLTVGDGMTGRDGKDADVLALQTILEKEGFSIDDSEQKGGAEFGESTAAAVVKFQAAHGIIQTGYVGPLTRAALNAIYGCGITTTTPSITILSPNGGEIYQAGQPIVVRWTSTHMAANQDLVVSLESNKGARITFSGTLNDGSETLTIPQNIETGKLYRIFIETPGIDAQKQTIATDYSDNYFTITSAVVSSDNTPSIYSASSYKGRARDVITLFGSRFLERVSLPIVQFIKDGSVIGGTYAQNVSSDRAQLQFIVDPIFVANSGAGTYKIRVANPYGDDYLYSNTIDFTILSSDQLSQPIISGVSGPQSLTANQQGTWSVNAHDVNGGNLSYSVNWGDTLEIKTCSSGAPCAVAQTTLQQSASFTHTYSQAGTYTITFTVTNTDGQSAQTTLTVSVVAPTPVSCVALPTCAQGYTPGDSYIDSNGCKSFKCVPVSVGATCLGTSQNVVEAALGNPGGTGPFEKLGLDISAHPEIMKYRIQWFNGVWSDWYTPGVNDRDWNDNLDGTPRRVWSYFDDHTHEYVKCNSSVTPITPVAPTTPVVPMEKTVQIQASALDSMKEILNQMLKAFQ